MTEIFLRIVDMSFMASWLIVAVLVLRAVFGKVSKNFCYVLWVFVGIRLMCPFSIESAFSLIPQQEIVKDTLNIEMKELQSAFEKTSFGDGAGTSFANSSSLENSGRNDESTSVQNVMNDSRYDEESQYKETAIENTHAIHLNDTTSTWIKENITSALACIWLIGVSSILCYALISFLKLRRKVAVSIRDKENIWICDAIATPFILGMIKPRIYMPSSISEEQKPYILAHEREHLRYHDNIWKPLGMLLLAIHWFNPLVWLSYILFCRDIEFACDERVIYQMNTQEKKQYMESLLLCSSPIHFHSLYSVAFGEINIRERIKKVLRYQKPTAWILGIGVCVCVIVAVCFMTNPKNENPEIDNPYGVKGLYELEKSYYGVDKAYSKVLHAEKADLNHDGIDDLVQIVTDDWNYELIKKEKWPCGFFTVHVFLGKENGGYEKNPVNGLGTDNASKVAWYLSLGGEWNGCYLLTEKEGKDYLIRFGIDKKDASVRYMYNIIDVAENGNANATEYQVTFANNPFNETWDEYPHREEVVPAFREELEPWLANAKILISCRESELLILNTDKASLDTESYFLELWTENESKLIAEYEALPGTERWEKVIYRETENAESYIDWIEKQTQSDFSEWFAEYDGEGKQIIFQRSGEKISMSIYDNIVYHPAGFLKDTVSKMVMVIAEDKSIEWHEPTNNSEEKFELMALEVSEQSILPIAENMWLLPYLNLYYEYNGIDEGLTYEERIWATNGDTLISGGVSVPRSEEAEKYFYILMKQDGVYRLERMENMMEP